ncbi:MAG: hypothetical protein RLZZ399_2611 [Verrucomicrobiota bacterium]|jgi:hypothetical protein
MPLPRRLVPELLDHLPPDAPDALQSRRELRLINHLMGNAHWISHSLRQHSPPPMRILELGAGDGSLAQDVWRFGAASPTDWTALDLAPRPASWPVHARWIQQDVFATPSLPDADVLLANLFLHHFEDHSLRNLARLIPKNCRLLLACEPVRRRRHLFQGKALSLLANLGHVTRHDMLASIHAGFRDQELPQLLCGEGWNWKVTQSALGAYRLRAWR